MRITAVNLPQDDQNGLKAIKMSRLSDLVLIAGQNGSGKSRLFQKIMSVANKKMTTQEFNIAKNKAVGMQRNIDVWEREINGWEINEVMQIDNASNIDSRKRAIIDSRKKLAEIQRSFEENNFIECNGVLNDKIQTVNFVPKKLNLDEYSELSLKSIDQRAGFLKNLGVSDSVPVGTLSYIKRVQDKWREATHQNQFVLNDQKDKVVDSYDNLCALMRKSFNANLERDDDGNPTIFGMSIEKAGFSDGQKVLLQLIVAIHAQGGNLSEVILMLDEPENHLHPKAIIEVVGLLRTLVSNGQIWIATHSVPLLAHFGAEYIWYMEDGGIEYAGKKAEKVLNSLLGDEQERAKLHDFVGLPMQLASTQYAFECLFPPKTVMTGHQDPQICQIRSVIEEILRSQQGKIKILDFGAGKGRLIANVVESNNKEQLIEGLEYVAFDPYPTDESECRANIERIFGDSNNKYFSNTNDLLSYHDQGSFDVVIMCNVLHEIPPESWMGLFRTDGSVTTLLKDSGYVLIVEDQHIPTGEKAYLKGFLVLDTPQLKSLFNIRSDQDSKFKFATGLDGRLKAHLIPKDCLSRINDESRKLAIEGTKNLAKARIRELREGGGTDYKSGQMHGFWVQQLANAELILNE